MKYMGSKRRIVREILPIILKDRRKNQVFVDIFCGGCSVVDAVSGARIANDSNFYLISLLKKLQEGWLPPEFLTEKEYQEIKNNKQNYPPELVGFVGFPCSYAAKWFGGYCRGFTSKGEPRDYTGEARRNCLKQAPNLKNIIFTNFDYQKLEIPADSILYCDKPYQNSTNYTENQKFNHEEFWNWAREKAENHQIFVSEYDAPPDFKVIWQKEIFSSLTRNTGGKKAMEKLFVFEG